MSTPLYPITYEFRFPDGRSRVYEIRLDSENLSFERPSQVFCPPEWAKLSFLKCAGCTIAEGQRDCCPSAANIAELVDQFKSDESTAAVEVRVTTPERTYVKETQVQYGLFSILGIIMATSGCPATNFLKPMARFHLPFSTHTETMVRSISFYLLRQYFRKKAGHDFDIDLHELERKYTEIQKVNEGILARIRSAVAQAGDTGRRGDAKDNALLILHAFSQILSMEITLKLESLQYLFQEE